MPHIHTQPGQHDHTVSAYIFRYQDDIPYVLLHRHRKYRKLMQPGGHVELSETPWQAICHEIVEETGYNLSQLQVLQPPFVQPAFKVANTTISPTSALQDTHEVFDGTIQDHFHDDNVYAFVTDELPLAAPLEGESNELQWLSAEQIKLWDDDDVVSAVKEITEYLFEHCVPIWKPVGLSQFSG